MEEKETKKTPKKTTTKKTTTEKKTTTKKATATKSTAAKKTTTKSTTSKKTTTPKKTTTKKTVEKVEVEQNIVEPIIEKEITKEELLERTVIIDGLTKDNLNEVVNNIEEDNIVLKNKVIKRSKVKKIMIIIISVLIATLIIGTAIYAFISTFKDKDELAKSSVDSNILEKVQKQQDRQDEIEEEKTNYTTGEYYDNIKQMDLRGFENKVLNGENFNAMIFSSTCLACAQFEKTMQPVLEELDVIVYKIDVIQLSDADRAILEDYYSFNITPTLFTVRDGVIKSELVGNHPTDEFKIWAEENLK